MWHVKGRKFSILVLAVDIEYPEGIYSFIMRWVIPGRGQVRALVNPMIGETLIQRHACHLCLMLEALKKRRARYESKRVKRFY